jgi:purine nucleosidase
MTIMDDTTGRLQVHAVGPLHNVALALKREPRIASKVELVAMGGNIYEGEEGKPPKPESNVRCGIPEAQAVLAANWKAFRLAPIDVTRGLRLTGDRYQKVHQSNAPAARATIEAYKVFEPNVKWANYDVTIESSTLHDTVAVYMGWSTDLLQMKRLPLRITDKGLTVIDEKDGNPVDVAVAWKNVERFKDLIVERMTAE